MKIYRCKHCGNIICHLNDSGVRVSCCGEEMMLLELKHDDFPGEKHVPVVENNNGIVKVTVGEVLHPMTPEHSIEWIILETDNGFKVKFLKPTDEPIANFTLDGDEKLVEVFEYCNLHGLWSKKCNNR